MFDLTARFSWRLQSGLSCTPRGRAEDGGEGLDNEIKQSRWRRRAALRSASGRHALRWPTATWVDSRNVEPSHQRTWRVTYSSSEAGNFPPLWCLPVFALFFVWFSPDETLEGFPTIPSFSYYPEVGEELDSSRDFLKMPVRLNRTNQSKDSLKEAGDIEFDKLKMKDRMRKPLPSSLLLRAVSWTPPSRGHCYASGMNPGTAR